MANRDSSVPKWGASPDGTSTSGSRPKGDVGALLDVYEGKYARFDGPIHRPWGKIEAIPSLGIAVVSLLSPEAPRPTGLALSAWNSAVHFFNWKVPIGRGDVRQTTALMFIGTFFISASIVSHSWMGLLIGIPLFALGAIPWWIVQRVPAVTFPVQQGRIPVGGDGGPEVIDLLMRMDGPTSTDRYQEDWSRAWAIVKGDIVVRDGRRR